MTKTHRLIFTILLITSHNSLALEKLEVLLDWHINADHAPLIIAKERGFFKEQNLDVVLIEPADPGDPPKMIASSKADIGITYQPEYMQHIDRGLPIIAFGSLVDQPLNCLVTLESQGIKKIEDLKGKSIATSNTGLSSIVIQTMLKHAGLDKQDVELIHVRYNLTQALLSGKVAAANGMMRNIEVPILKSRKQSVKAFLPEDYGVPKYHELIYITHINNQTNKSLSRFISALTKATSWLKQHPKLGWQIFIREHPDLNNTMNKNAWFATIPLITDQPAKFNAEDWQNFANFMHENRLIQKTQPLNRYYVVTK